MTRPGDRLRAFATGWCCPETMERVIDPLIADLQIECAEAVRRGRLWRSRLIRANGWIAFVKVLAACGWAGILQSQWRFTAEDRRAVVRAVAFSVALIIALTALMEIDVLLHLWRSHSPRRWLRLYQIPQALPVSASFGAMLGIVVGIRRRAVSTRIVTGVVAFATVVSLMSFLNLNWMVPAANQAFRVAATGRSDLPKARPELTLGELSREIEAARRDANDQPWTQRYLRDLRYHYHSRWAWSFSPLVFGLFAVSIATGRRLTTWTLGIAAIPVFIGLAYLGQRILPVPVYVSAWLPNLGLVSIASLLMVGRLLASADYEPAR